MQISATSNPLEVFTGWLNEARLHGQIREATAMALATIDAEGQLHNRIVLCKSWSEGGFTFFTNYDSRKGFDLAHHSQAGVVFYWDPMARQVRVTGPVQKVPRAESEAYWRTRPRESQLSGYISRQSQPVASREVLDLAWTEAEREFKDREIPCPANWGGYLLVPKQIEFWVGQPGRLHDRYQFEKSGKTWTFRRLCP